MDLNPKQVDRARVDWAFPKCKDAFFAIHNKYFFQSWWQRIFGVNYVRANAEWKNLLATANALYELAAGANTEYVVHAMQLLDCVEKMGVMFSHLEAKAAGKPVSPDWNKDLDSYRQSLSLLEYICR